MKTKEWVKNYNKEYVRKRENVCRTSYHHNVAHSIERGHPAPEYNVDELIEWEMSQHNFEELYLSWVSADYAKDLKPSIDRLDDSKGYSFSNIELKTWKENNNKQYDISKSAKGKDCKVVKQYDLDGVLLNSFYSVRNAADTLEISMSCIARAARKERKTYKGYIWSY